MAKLLFVALFALIAAQSITAAPQKKAQKAAAPVEKSQLEELAANTQKVFDDIKTQLEKDLPDSKKVVESLNKQTQEAANTLKTISKKLSEEVEAHKPEVDNLVKQVSAKLNEASTQLQTALGPDTSAKAKELRTKLEDNLKNALAEVDKLVKAAEPDVKKATNDFNSFAKSALESLNNLGKSLNEQIKTAVADHEKTHKH